MGKITNVALSKITTLFRTLISAALLVSLSGKADAESQLRVGHFPNITHVQALVAHNLSRQGKGWFEQRLGPEVRIEWFVYNAGPSAMEAIFADSIDLAYVGPNPAINAYAKARGEEIRIIAGAVNGGAALVVQPDLDINNPADFKGRRVGTPQFGNTQDVAARAWLSAGGLKVTQTGGDVQVLPTANPDQLALFKTKQLDAVWTVEPWVSRLETEAGARVSTRAARHDHDRARLQRQGACREPEAGAGIRRCAPGVDGVDSRKSGRSAAIGARGTGSGDPLPLSCRSRRARVEAHRSHRRDRNRTSRRIPGRAPNRSDS